MIPNLARYLSRTILVSIPAVFEDPFCRPCTLVGAEITGLWLQSEELADRLLPSESADLARLEPVVFVPFAQVAGVLVATAAPQQPLATSAPAAATTPAGPTKRSPSQAGPEHEKAGKGQPKKGPKKH